MKTVVIDTGVFWRHESHLWLKAWLPGFVLPVMSNEIFAEYEAPEFALHRSSSRVG